MTRTQAVELCLVNWKGVFCESYLLDRHVTALEGANGAGKTTVMIAAYLVLFPDLSRLRFTNLGESAGTGGDKGIWGRLGELGRPSYSALRLLRSDGSELLIGVHALRKAEPTLELTPFLISDLKPEVRTQQLLLLQSEVHEEVPTLRELGENAAKLGAGFATFPTLKDYFSMLFELGISPLRLASDEEKGKFNDMLRTSMTGGISRALTTDLRQFLLKEEGGLLGTLGRMRSNLDACRRTRLEVSQARLLEHEISGIYTAGHAMFSRAVLATERSIRESGDKLERCRAERETEQSRVTELELTLGESRRRQSAMMTKLGELKASLETLSKRTERLERARGLAAKADELGRELERAESVSDTATASQKVADSRRKEAKEERLRAQDALARSAQGLANLQQGLEELHRRAHAYRRAVQSLAQVRELLREPEFDPASVEERLLATSTRRNELDQARGRRDREIETAERRRAEYQLAHEALGSLHGDLTDVSDLYAVARDELRTWEECDRLSVRLDELLHVEQRKSAELRQKEQLTRRLQALDSALPVAPQELSKALNGFDEALLSLEDTQSAAEVRLENAIAEAAKCGQALKQLEELRARFSQVAQAEKRAEALVGVLPVNLAAVGAQRKLLDSEIRRTRRELDRLSAERERLLEEAKGLEQAGGADGELLRLRDAVSGELLAERFEDLEVEAAHRLQAELGPLANALVVMDPEAAAAALSAAPREQSTVWLIQAGTLVGGQTSREVKGAHGVDVIVPTEFGLRVTRVEATGTLSRRARERRAEQLREEAERHGLQLETLQLWLPRAEAGREALELLEREFELWRNGDPALRQGELQKEYSAREAEKDACRQEARAVAERVRALKGKLNALRPLLAEAWLLENAPEPSDVAVARQAVAKAREASAKWALHAHEVRCLKAHVEALAMPPPDARSLAAWEVERKKSEAERDQLFAVSEALEQLAEWRHALAWHEAPERLASSSALVPELEAQHEASRRALEEVEQRLLEAEAVWERLTTEAQAATAEKLAVAAHLKRVNEELALEQVEDLSDQALLESQTQLASAASAQAALELEERTLLKEVALREASHKQALRALDLAKVAEEKERALRAPSEEAWARLREALSESGVLGGALSLAEANELSEASSLSLWAESRSKRELLLDRLRAARGGVELAESLNESSRTAAAHAPWEQYLAEWMSVRQWLRRRLPPQVAEVEDPLEALSHLGADLGRLEGRLERQETDLRGTSEDVARSIEVQLRKATGQVRRLNQYLEGVHFGSIAGIRVELGRVERMDQVLAALRTGTAQELLFQSNLPIEEAMDEIFRRYGGGRTGGQKLLDYREYLELRVEVRRQTKDTWEAVNPTQVSTGEAIGVGAALMMVILTEWERDANLLRSRRTDGCLRFLFLDEANRLSQDNLAILFDLCENLDLQLLIAAPEVAHSDGNTTYRLVRRVSDDGKEEVLVSGRRAKMPEWPPQTEVSASRLPEAQAPAELHAPVASDLAELRPLEMGASGELSEGVVEHMSNTAESNAAESNAAESNTAESNAAESNDTTKPVQRNLFDF
ncbi:MAG: chromosome partition protein MukB [Polyangiaceae bacterium]|nr:chromosome partition protein MukB [Polyangiaceae bacterium]